MGVPKCVKLLVSVALPSALSRDYYYYYLLLLLLYLLFSF
jgi:hypothetical protein